MLTIRNVLYVGTFSVLALSLTGCESMKTARDKISSIDFPYFGDSESDIAADEDGVVMASTEGCPQVAVVDDLKNLTQFEIPSAPTPGTKISSIAITGVKSSCNVTEKTVAVDMGLRFDGQLGPKAAEWKTESHSFAYPYFIAVTTPAGEILSKEVFAATIRYDSGEAAITQEESIRQVIPLREGMTAAGYEILVGFQLTSDELNYARMIAAQPVTASVEEAVSETKAAAVPPVTAPAAPTPLEAPVVEAPVEQPVPTTTDGSVTAAPTQTEVAEEAPTPVTTAPAPVEPTPTPVEPATEESAAPAPAVNPYATPSPQTQVIRIKPDGSVETQKN